MQKVQQKTDRYGNYEISDKIIINADDFGKTESRNKAIDYCFRNHICSQSSIIVNTDSFSSAVQLAKEGNYIEHCGFHLNLTEGVPLTEEIKDTCMCDSHGHFKRNLSKTLLKRMFDSKLKYAIENETSEQMKRYRDNGFTSNRFDSHHWISCEPIVYNAIVNSIKKYNFKMIRTMNGHFMSLHSRKMRLYYKAVWIRTMCAGFKTVEWSGCESEYFDFLNSSVCDKIVEVYIHPDIVDGNIIETLFSYTGGVKKSVDIRKVQQLFSEYKLTTYDEVLE